LHLLIESDREQIFDALLRVVILNNSTHRPSGRTHRTEMNTFRYVPRCWQKLTVIAIPIRSPSLFDCGYELVTTVQELIFLRYVILPDVTADVIKGPQWSCSGEWESWEIIAESPTDNLTVADS